MKCLCLFISLFLISLFNFSLQIKNKNQNKNKNEYKSSSSLRKNINDSYLKKDLINLNANKIDVTGGSKLHIKENTINNQVKNKNI